MLHLRAIRRTLLSGLTVPAVLFACVLILFAPRAHADRDFLDPEDAFVFSAAMVTPTELVVQFAIAPDYYMYREQFRFAVAEPGQWLGTPQFPTGKIKYDPTFDKEMEVYTTAVRIALPVQAGATEPLTLEVVSQGCAEAGLCYAPMHSTLQLVPAMAGYDVSGPGAGPLAQLTSIVPATASGSARASLTALAAGGDLALADFLATAQLWHVVLAGLVLGLLLSFTPCVLPMVPILLSLIAGSAAREVARDAHLTKGRSLALAFLYVLGMSVVYTGLGMAAGLLGASLAAWLQTPWVLTLFAMLLALLALGMFGVLRVQVPSALQTAVQTRLARMSGGRYGAALVMGMVSALIVGPCVAAPLAGVLLFISTTGDVLLGGLALFALAWGQGVVLLVLGASSGMLLPRAGAWMERINHGFGVLLLATGWWMLIPVLPAVVLTLGWVVLAFWTALIFGALRPLPADVGPGRMLTCALGYGFVLWGALMLIGLASGGHDALQPLRHLTLSTATVSASASGTSSPSTQFTRIRSLDDLQRALARTRTPVMLDFYADWCISCKEMERFTFSDPQVARQLTRLTLLQADVTGDTADDRALLKQFRLFGPPGIVFFDAQGQVLPATRIIGFQNAERFSAVLTRVLMGTAR